MPESPIRNSTYSTFISHINCSVTGFLKLTLSLAIGPYELRITNRNTFKPSLRVLSMTAESKDNNRKDLKKIHNQSKIEPQIDDYVPIRDECSTPELIQRDIEVHDFMRAIIYINMPHNDEAHRTYRLTQHAYQQMVYDEDPDNRRSNKEIADSIVDLLVNTLDILPRDSIIPDIATNEKEI